MITVMVRNPRSLAAWVTALTAGATALLVAPSAATAASHPPVVQVVAAENFWGSIASQLGGSDVSVTSLITNPNADPHLFESNATDAAKLAQARVVIENGVGYDTFMQSLLAADGTHPTIVTAASVLHVTGSDPNPHLWYDIPKVPRVAAAITAALTKADPTAGPAFRRNLARFDASLAPIITTLSTIAHTFHGAPVAYTERVPGYLLADAGLSVRTPVGFATAVEQGTDPGPADTIAMQGLITGHRIAVLLYNVQTVTPVTAQIRQLARKNHVPIVGVAETLPTSFRTYQQWQQSQASALLRALQASRARSSPSS
jgi:zinc/manganese transport system substrate-binding protein